MIQVVGSDLTYKANELDKNFKYSDEFKYGKGRGKPTIQTQGM